jgi:hypothetical protein
LLFRRKAQSLERKPYLEFNRSRTERVLRLLKALMRDVISLCIGRTDDVTAVAEAERIVDVVCSGPRLDRKTLPQHSVPE